MRCLWLILACSPFNTGFEGKVASSLSTPDESTRLDLPSSPTLLSRQAGFQASITVMAGYTTGFRYRHRDARYA